MSRSIGMRVFGLLLPIFAYLILGYTVYVYNVRLCGYSIIASGELGRAVGYLIPCDIIFILAAWSYFRALTTKPGSPTHPVALKRRHAHSPILPIHTPLTSFHDYRVMPPGYSPATFDLTTFEVKPSEARNATDSTSAPPINLCKRDGQPRFCDKCQCVKPDRTHHCAECDECVLKMDHHCPWINGCVGFRNYKYFLLFVTYTAFYALWVIATSLPVIIVNFEDHGIYLDFQLLIMVVFAGLFGVLLAAFASVHISYVLANKTTIEAISEQQSHVRVGLPDGPQVVTTSFRDHKEHIWSLGSRKKNWESVMGRVWWKWFLPIETTLGTGITFPYHPNVYSRLVSEAEQENRPMPPPLAMAHEEEEEEEEESEISAERQG